MGMTTPQLPWFQCRTDRNAAGVLRLPLLAAFLIAAACDVRTRNVDSSAVARDARSQAAGAGIQAVSITPAQFQTLRSAIRDRRAVSMPANDLLLQIEMDEGPLGAIPTFVIESSEPSRNRRTLIFLVGGPGDSILLGGPLLSTLISLARSGVEIRIPAYLGTAERTVYPEADLPLAIGEVAALTTRIQASDQPAVAVAGVSGGGYVAAAASASLPGVPIIMLSPLLTTPTELLQFYEATSSPRRRLTDARLRQRFVRRGASLIPSEERLIGNFALTRSFFGVYRNVDMQELIAEGRGCYHVIFGEDDDRIGVEQVPRLRAMHPDVQFFEVESFGHDYLTSDAYRQVEEIFVRLVMSSECPAEASR